MRLQLGRYSKALEDRFAELAIEARNIRSATREKDLMKVTQALLVILRLKLNLFDLLLEKEVVVVAQC